MSGKPVAGSECPITALRVMPEMHYLWRAIDQEGEILKSYKKVIIPELNMGQLRTLIRSKYLVDALGFNKVKGRPFTIAELTGVIKDNLPK